MKLKCRVTDTINAHMHMHWKIMVSVLQCFPFSASIVRVMLFFMNS